jgi:hypothetical protein
LPSCVRTSASPGPANATSKFEQTQVWRWLWHDKSRHLIAMRKSSLCFPVFCQNCRSFFSLGF